MVGFSLIEVIVALAVVALVALAVPQTAGRGPQADVAIHELAAALAGARMDAMRTGRETAVEIDLGAGAYRAGEQKPGMLPEGAALRLTVGHTEIRGERRGTIRFFPDGSSTGGTIAIQNDRDSTEITVDWLTGRVGIHD